MSAVSEQGAWERAARALAAGDAGAFGEACRELPRAAARALEGIAGDGSGASVPAFEPPPGVEWIASGRFAAFFARRSAVFRWTHPGRELVTGCYIAPGGSAEFRLEPGECRFIVLQGEGGA